MNMLRDRRHTSRGKSYYYYYDYHYYYDDYYYYNYNHNYYYYHYYYYYYYDYYYYYYDYYYYYYYYLQSSVEMVGATRHFSKHRPGVVAQGVRLVFGFEFEGLRAWI